MGPQVTIGLGIPRTGRGAPNVKEPGWIGQEFTVHGHPLAVFVNSEGLTIAGPRPATRSSATDATIAGFADGPAPAGAAAIPQSLAGYRLLDRLGEGGMGVVFKAHHATLDRQAAMKVMRPEFAQNERFVARFLREARTAAKIDHPNVVNVYDAGVQDGCLFIAMRFVPGGDLAQVLRDKGPMPQLDALVVIARCLMGLQAISDGGMIHRDIKPANILLELDGNPRIADLGLAKGVEMDDQLSQAGSVQGTPSFMSPEQARSNANLDVRSDIYSIAATLYALLVGAPPFTSDSAYETVSHVLTREAVPPGRRVAGILPAVDDLVMRALAKDPARRPQTPLEFIDEISAIVPQLSSSAVLGASGRLRTPLPEGGRTSTSTSLAARPDPKTRSGEHWLSRWLLGRGKS
jgi:serine/threonine-protein kinase